MVEIVLVDQPPVSVTRHIAIRKMVSKNPKGTRPGIKAQVLAA
jgi:hypothetical protein